MCIYSDTSTLFLPAFAMFNDEFFPTPAAVIEKMIAPLFITYMGYPDSSFFGPSRYEKEVEMRSFPYDTVLDPSAGSGAILDYVGEVLNKQSRGGYKENKKFYCFETDPTLQATLQGKNYRMLGHDFLKYSGDMPLSLILMNPPFSCGDLHVLHAYHVVAPEGRVVALVNSETLRNPYTRTRQQLLNLIEQVGGEVEELGACFADSERATDVEVSIIRLQKPASADRFSFDWKNESKEREFDTSKHNTRELADRDLIGSMLTRYDCLREQFMNLLRAIDGIKHYGAGLSLGRSTRDAWRIARDVIESPTGKGKDSYREQYLSFTEEMRQQIWQVVLEKVGIQKFMTAAVRENFTKYSVAQGYMDFTKENVGQLVSMVLNNTGNILEVAVGQLFDNFTSHYHENRLHVEGWKTNSRYKVNRKIILPNWVEFGEFSAGFSVSWRHRDIYSDVDKVCCYLSGERYESTCLISDALEAKFKELGRVGSGSFDGYCVSKFFRIRFFKKGTIHLEFLDEKLWQEFNLRACAGKLWLPDEEQQAYQTRKTSPFPKAAPAPGTDMAALHGLAEREALMQQLLGPPESSEPTLTSSPEPEATTLMNVAGDWAEEVEVLDATPAVVGATVAAPVAAAPVSRRLVVAPPRRGRTTPAVPAGQFSLFDSFPEVTEQLAAA